MRSEKWEMRKWGNGKQTADILRHQRKVNVHVQWNPSITDTFGDQHFVCYSEVSQCNSGASGIFPVGVVLRNPAVEFNVAAFSELSFAVRWQGRLSRG